MQNNTSDLNTATSFTLAPLDVVIMAAGKGTRMKIRIPKVLQKLAGRPLLHHYWIRRAPAGPPAVIITGHGAIEVEALCAADTLTPIGLEMRAPGAAVGNRGAVQQAVPALADDGLVLILSGDVPLTQPALPFAGGQRARAWRC